MSGLEVPAAIVGFVSLGFQCLAGCVEGFQLISTALHLGKHASYFRCAVLLEEQRLLFWAKRSGFTDNKLDPRLNQILVVETLGNLKDLLTSTDKLSEKYGLKIQPADDPAGLQTSPSYDAVSGEDLSFLMSEELQQEHNKIVERAKKMQEKANLVKKFWFAAVDKQNFGEFLSKISYIIQRLHDLLNDSVQDELREAMNLQLLKIVGLSSKLDQILTIVEANSLRGTGNLPEIISAILKGINLVDGKAGPNGTESREMRQFLDKVSDKSHASLQFLFVDRVIDRKTFEEQAARGTVTYDGTQYYVEWKKYDWPDADDAKKVLDSIVNLALLLNAPKHPSFRTLNCYGIVAEPRSPQYMFLYRWPSEREGYAPPKSLLEYLSSSYKPSLTARLQLACELAKSLLLLHAANWMHKALSSKNIVFFPKTSSAVRSLDEPFIVGFNFSRQDQKGEPSEKLAQSPEIDIYRHPDCLRGLSFHKTYDIYSLGLILLELAKWRPLKEIFARSARERYLAKTKQDEKKMNKEDLHKLDKKLWEKCGVEDIDYMRQTLVDSDRKDSHPADVAFRAGSSYSDVMLSCLRSDFGRFRDVEDNGGLREEFFMKVLKPLERSVV